MSYDTDIKNVEGVNRLTLNARRAVAQGYELAKQYKYPQYRIMHLFLALLMSKDGFVNEVFARLAVDIDSTTERIKQELTKNSDKGELVTQTVFSEEMKKLLNESFVVASELGHVYVGTEHLLLAMFKLDDIDFIKEMKNVGITFSVLKNTTQSIGTYPILNSSWEDQSEDDADGERSVLPFFCKDMVEQSKNGEFMKITGRDNEIRRLIHILSRKTKNNPILVGDAGVGKTAIVEGFVNMLVAKQVPNSFLNKRVINLDIAAILAGARLRGDVEERLTSVINEVMDDGNTILFIDEIHTIVGAGSAGGKDSMDIANILKPYLTGSELSVIGATTLDEYSKYFETDSALTRRFQPIMVDELSIDSAKEVLYNLAPSFEEYHKVKIDKRAVEQAVVLSSKFIQDRYLPDKAIDIIDEAAASVKIGRERAIEPELSKLGEKLVSVQKKKNLAVKSKNMPKAAMLKKEEESLLDQVQDVLDGKIKATKKYSKRVTEELIKEIIVDWTKIPLVASDISNKKLKDLASNIKKRIVGQDRVVENIAMAIQRSHLGLNGGGRPLASFLFLGPTGVGKTELAKTIAKELFGSSNLLFRIDMSEFMEMHSVSKLIGSPPGYVGYQEGGQLTTFVRRKPYSVILFDEIEKAHPDVLNILLQILEEGELTDGKGLKVSLKNTIIVMTSNIGASDVSKDNHLGFDVNLGKKRDAEIDIAYEEMREKIMEDLQLTLPPELLNRIDLIDIFRGLNKKDCLEITKILVNDFIIRILDQGIMLDVSSDVINLINEEGYSEEYGGRNIRRKVQELLENSLTQFLLESDIPVKRKSVMQINADMSGKKLVFKLVS
jgi:ATP-dependent Clp protease ATP-binding subunit ClpC